MSIIEEDVVREVQASKAWFQPKIHMLINFVNAFVLNVDTSGASRLDRRCFQRLYDDRSKDGSIARGSITPEESQALLKQFFRGGAPLQGIL